MASPSFIDSNTLDYMPSFDPNNIKDKITKLTMNNNPWNMANSGGSVLGKPGSALGAGAGPALGSYGPALGTEAGRTGVFNGSLTMPSKTAPHFTPDKAGKANGMSGMDMASMGVGMANSAGVPQAIFGKPVGNVLGGGASGAMSGFAMGGPVGAGIGGGLGALQGFMGNKDGSKKPYNGPTGTADPNSFYMG